MTKKHIVPSNVFYVSVPTDEVYRRTEPHKDTVFDCDRTVLKARLGHLHHNLPETLFYYRSIFGNVTSIDGTKSRWFMQDVSTDALQENLKARMNFARDYWHGLSENRPCIMEKLNCERSIFKQTLSQYGYFCPVSWKVQKKFVSCTHNPELSVLYQNYFYYFASRIERDMFVAHPDRFTSKVIFSAERNCPMRFRPHKAAELVAQEKHLMGYCPVSLKDEGRVEKGNQILIVQFKDNRFIMATEEKAIRFFENPARYVREQLPVKMPPTQDPVSL